MDPKPPALEGVREDDLGQFLGLALMGILPLAETQARHLHDEAHDYSSDCELQEEARTAHEAVTRAQKALNMVNAHPQWNSRGLHVSHFDETFQIKFDEE